MLNKGTETRSLSPAITLLRRKPGLGLNWVEGRAFSSPFSLLGHQLGRLSCPAQTCSFYFCCCGHAPRVAPNGNKNRTAGPVMGSGRRERRVSSSEFGGDAQNRTGDGGFADLCLATWLRRPESKSILP